MKYNIAIVGSGQLGSRHLQALSLVKQPLNIWVIDPGTASLETARLRWNEVAENTVHSIRFESDLSVLPSDLFLVVVATSSMVRRKVIESLLQISTMKYLVLEKILFPCLEDYNIVRDKLSQKGVTTWVNCPRRQYPGYIQLKNEIKDVPFVMTVNGSSWGFACNTIHWIDIFSYLSNDHNVQITPFLDQHLIKSKREGYLELSGMLTVTNVKGNKLVIQCFDGGDHPLEARIELPGHSYFIEESKQRIKIRESGKDWKSEMAEFPVLRQSQLTNLITEDLIEQGTCQLTSLEESSMLHMPMIEVFLGKINQYNNTPSNKLCPLT